MLIYEKKVNGENHLFGTESNIPSDSDTQLAYKDGEGETVDVKDLKYFYQKHEDMFANKSTNQLPADDDQKVNVWVGDKLIIGSENEVKASNESEEAEG